MNYYSLPLSSSPWQIFTLDMTLEGEGFQAQVELRYLPAPDRWFVSIWDHAAGELLVNMIPLVCSCGELNDLLRPFRHLRNGKSLGSLFCLRGTEEPDTPDPTEKNLTDYQVLFGDTL